MSNSKAEVRFLLLSGPSRKVRKKAKLHRNSRCQCGSGIKVKRCCGGV